MFNSINNKIKKRIEEMPMGSVFSLADFADLADPKTVSKTLTRLAESKLLEKTMRGIFHKPLEGNLLPTPHDVAKALARGNSWLLVPSGETALHLIGAGKGEPKIWTYVTDGTNREYEYGNYVIRFRHASGKFMKSMSEKTALLVQVIKEWGPHMPIEEMRQKLLSHFHKSEYLNIISESRNTTSWISEKIKLMFGKTDGSAE